MSSLVKGGDDLHPTEFLGGLSEVTWSGRSTLLLVCGEDSVHLPLCCFSPSPASQGATLHQRGLASRVSPAQNKRSLKGMFHVNSKTLRTLLK